jgi:mono/diheme cytochrome c family protein
LIVRKDAAAGAPQSRPMRRLLVILALAVAIPARAAEAPGASEARGQALVQRNCGMCHAVGRSGASPNPAAPAFRDLNRRYGIEDLGEALAEGLITGHPEMPEFRFSPAEVDDIIRYLNSIQTRRAASAGRAGGSGVE